MKSLAQLAKDLEESHTAVVDAAHEFYRKMGSKTLGLQPPVEVKIPGPVVNDLLATVQDWKDAGEALIAAQRKQAQPKRMAKKRSPR